MKNPTNNLTVYHYKRVPQKTFYPKLIETDTGSKIIHVAIENSDINSGLKSSDFSLDSLLKAGVNPETMHINTTTSKIDAFTQLTNELKGIDLPSEEIIQDNTNN